MIKVVGDIHFGLRRNSNLFHEALMESLNWFKKSLKKTDSVVVLGDIFDSRSSVDFQILNDAVDFFIDLSTKCKEVFVLVGNHDLYYKENDIQNVNCRFLRFAPEGKGKAPVHVVNEVSQIKIQGKKCLFIPWVDTVEMKSAATKAMEEEHDAIFGHFDSVGLYGEVESDHELMFDQDDFGPNKVILSGHYHKRAQKGVINYVGAFINQTFNDVGDIKGYHTIDKNGDVKFIEGICPKFEYVTINNSAGFLKGFQLATDEEKEKVISRVRGNIIKLILNEYSTENDELYKVFKGMTPLEISISYNRVAFEDGVDGEETFEGFDAKSDIMEIISQYINKVQRKLPEGVKPNDIVDLISKKHAEFKSVG